MKLLKKYKIKIISKKKLYINDRFSEKNLKTIKNNNLIILQFLLIAYLTKSYTDINDDTPNINE